MSDDNDELSKTMQAELKKFNSAKYGYKDRTGMTMQEVCDQIGEEIKDQEVRAARWSKK